METIGEKIRKLRREQNLSQEDLALEIGVSRQTVHKWEIESMQPNAENLKALGDYFNIDINYFFLDSDTPIINTETAVTELKPKSKYKLAILIILFVITLLALIVSTIFTVESALVSFTDNVGHEKVSSLMIDCSTFYIFLFLSLILLALDVVIIFYIKKQIK